MGQAGDHLLPVAKAEDPGKHEVAGAGEQIVRGQQPAEVAKAGARSGSMCRQQRQRSGSQVDESSACLDPSILMQA